jgi:diketogulonate reductase-like aldo/keto reductase
LGTYRLGSLTYEVCRAALDLGYRHLDTAALYKNEAAVAQAVAASGVDRSQIFVVSKIQARDLLKKDRVIPAARESVDRLGSIDLLLLHAPVGDPARAWEELQEVATWPEVGAVGVSNFGCTHLQQLGPPLPAWNQIEASPFLQRRDVAEWCRQRGIGLVAHSPLTKRERMRHPVLEDIARNHGASTAQVLIAWSLAQGFVVIPRTSNRDHLAENLAAQHLQLSSAELDRLATLEDGFATHPQHLQV